ncbi:hypothetical protein PC112_g23570 [Phytophthora cactorum]|nr:hypothetical protein PC112_g23570 [Phytophthora cactorum]
MFKSEPQGQLAKDLVGLAERVGVGQLVLQLELGIFLSKHSVTRSVVSDHADVRELPLTPFPWNARPVVDATCRQHRKGPRSFMRYVFRVCEPVPIAQTPLAK